MESSACRLHSRPTRTTSLPGGPARCPRPRSSCGVCLNAAEGAGRVTKPDKARAFTIARGEGVEAAAAVEIAALTGDADAAAAERCVVIANRVVALLTGLIRR